MRQETLCHQWIKCFLFWKDGILFRSTKEGRKISWFKEIKVSRKGQMFLKYRNRQWRSAIWPSIFMFNRKFPSITGFLFLFRPTKRWKISHHIIALVVVILSRFQCITCLVWQYIPFLHPTLIQADDLFVIDNAHCASCFGKNNHDGNEDCIQCPALS